MKYIICSSTTFVCVYSLDETSIVIAYRTTHVLTCPVMKGLKSLFSFYLWFTRDVRTCKNGMTNLSKLVVLTLTSWDCSCFLYRDNLIYIWVAVCFTKNIWALILSLVRKIWPSSIKFDIKYYAIDWQFDCSDLSYYS